ncbi:MAG: hypothetical protein ABIL01_31160 [Pseudomonadota bacterium]
MNLSHPITRLALAIAAAAGWMMLLSPISHLVAPVSQSIDPAGITSSVGSSYVAPATLRPPHPAFFQIACDHLFGPRASNLSLLENGKALGPPHSFHSSIWEPGRGHYSHWGDSTASVVVFSTSDNSDPRTNGRSYVIVAQPEFTPLVVSMLLIVALTASLLLAKAVSLPWRGGTIAIAAAALISWIWLYFGQVSVAEDSSAYVGWQRTVPLGYPLFLSAINYATGTLRWTGAIQVALLTAACIFIAWQINRLSGRAAPGFVALVLLLVCTPAFAIEQGILSEGLFLPLILINIGAALGLIRRLEISYALLLALSAALIMLVRPAGYFAVVGILFFVIAGRSRLWWLRWAVAPLLLLIACSFVLNMAVRGSSSQSQVGRVLFPHVAFLLDPQAVTDENRIYAQAVYDAIAKSRAGYQSTKTRMAQFNFLLNDYNQRLLASDAAIHRQLILQPRAPEPGQDERAARFRRMNDIYLSLFLSTIAHEPLAYLRLVAEQLIGAWQYSILYDYGQFKQVHQLVADTGYQDRVQIVTSRNVPLTPQDVRLNPEAMESFPGYVIQTLDTAYRNIRTQRPVIYLIGLVTLIAIPVGGLLRRQSWHWMALGYCGVMIHGSMLLTAATTVFIPRYALPVDPVILLAGAIMADGILVWATRMWRNAKGMAAPFRSTVS